MYWMGTKDEMARRMEQARAAGAKGLIATLDWSFSHSRDWGSPWIPERLDLKAMAKLAPQAVTRPRWLYEYAKTRRLPDLTTPNLADPGAEPPTFFGAYGQWMQTPPRRGRTSAGCASSGTGRSCSRACAGSTTPCARWTPG